MSSTEDRKSRRPRIGDLVETTGLHGQSITGHVASVLGGRMTIALLDAPQIQIPVNAESVRIPSTKEPPS